MPKQFIGTNLLVYALDGGDSKKQKIARSFLKGCTSARSGVISTQVLQEFFVVSTKKMNVDPMLVKDMLRGFSHFEVITITPELIASAIDCTVLYKLSFWDALIISAAESASCDEIWSEDLNEGQLIRGIKICSPF
jgi:predicted nucleic acid-binding protein